MRYGAVILTLPKGKRRMPNDSFRVALTDGLRHERVVEHRQPLDAIGATLDVVPAPTNDDEAVERLAGYDGVIFSHGPYRLRSFDQLPDLIGVIAPTVGVDHIDVEAATAAGVVVGNIPTFATEQTADVAMYLMLGAVRRVPQILEQWRAGQRGIADWERHVQPVGDMRGSVLSLIGLGRIARAVALRAQAFGTRCIAYAPTISPWEAQGLGVELVGLSEAFSTADIVSIHLPYTPATHHFVNADLIAQMKPSAVLINVARGPIVDEAALITALESGSLAGAGVDVFEVEPPTPSTPLINLTNVVWTPHIGGSTTVSIHRVGEGAAEQMAWIADGCWPRDVINRSVEPRKPLRHRGYPPPA